MRTLKQQLKMRLFYFGLFFLLLSLAQIAEIRSGLLDVVKSNIDDLFTKAVPIWKQVTGLIEHINPPAIPLPTPTTTTPVSLEEAIHFAQLASIAQCDNAGLEDWTCKECIANHGDVDLIGVYQNSTLETLTYIGLDHTRKEILVVNRGTSNLINIIEDLKIEQVPSGYEDGVKFHRGFYENTLSLQNQIFPVVRELVAKHPGYSIVQAGHSLGGAISTISYYLLRHDPELKDKATRLITFGEPRPGNEELANFIDSQQPLVLGRVVHGGDIIPHIYPYSQGFFHHLTELWIQHNGETKTCRTDLYEDPSCSNSLWFFQYSIPDHLSYFDISFDGSKGC